MKIYKILIILFLNLNLFQPAPATAMQSEHYIYKNYYNRRESTVYKYLYTAGLFLGAGTGIGTYFLTKNPFGNHISAPVSSMLGLVAGWYLFKILEQETLRMWPLFELTLPDECFDVEEIPGSFASYMMPHNLVKNLKLKTKFKKSVDIGEINEIFKDKKYMSHPDVKTVIVPYFLFLPKPNDKRKLAPGKKFPAIVFCPHSNGIFRGVQRHALWLAKQGIACIVVDSFGQFATKKIPGEKRGRNIKSTIKNQFLLSLEETVIDAYLARRILVKHFSDVIDVDRIGITGSSRGSDTATAAQQKYYYSNASHDGKPFELCYANYPSTFSQPEEIEGEVTNKPYLALLGRKDDCTPHQATKNFVKRLQKAGIPADYKVYWNGYHAFDEDLILDLAPLGFRLLMPLINAIPGLSKLTRLAMPFKVMNAGNAYYMRKKSTFLPIDLNGNPAPQYGEEQDYKDLSKHCIKHCEMSKIWPGYNAGVHRSALHDTQDFLKKYGFLES
ncbi:dienelactone hydrolase family protein [Candidatus Dependentiae bacterium]